ncbi:MAG: M20/M25/M40 family metallo-hydrolase [Halobacteriovoraceae bacterium]|nr:M20/M25/M40 family metallo-hydrolase [Halobacteriovoraceae bacterium]
MKFLSLSIQFGLLSLFLFSSDIFADNEKMVTVTMGSDLYKAVFNSDYKGNLGEGDGIHLVNVPQSKLEELSHEAHESFNRCGGFMVHEDKESAEVELAFSFERSSAQKAIWENYSIDREDQVNALIPEVKENNILKVIQKLSSFKNRYYKSQTGVDSQNWLINHWKQITQSRSDVVVSRFEHSGYPQDTIIATFKGASDQKIVIGGHADSVAGWWRRERARAPGADDNASGIATLTEIMRVLVQTGYQPQNTIVFAAYAAEEVGLLGSKDLAGTFKNNNEIVKGVLQLDMTNFNGSEKDILLVADHTNEAQNQFIGTLIDKYLPGLNWGYTKCGYACSDHASWTSQGYPASFPFEAEKGDTNRHIHTDKDTVSRSGDSAQHAQKFAKVGVAWLVELDK